jgi:hypothetical protein
LNKQGRADQDGCLEEVSSNVWTYYDSYYGYYYPALSEYYIELFDYCMDKYFEATDDGELEGEKFYQDQYFYTYEGK